ncbi:heme-binding protein [Mycolicibacterium stellerae]|uniref:heme-binding protein n=1 Tax=Mycolicibacterium stellerae TaxID=2358193 RepID=UPI000F0B4CFD|nr:heme-binding protein [Mycolicibacterium stellerae]
MKLFVCTAMIGAALFAGTPLAYANEDPNANPPNCSAADLEFARAGVQQATADYLFGHPDVNNFYNSLEGLTRDQSTPKVQAYMKAHPKTKADLTAIRQPLMDIKNRCGNPAPPPPPTP